MRNKILVLVVLFVVGIANAQNTNYSPYSSYGLGEIGGQENATFVGIGNSNITYFDSTILNYFNPATYNTYGSGQPLFSLGVTSRLSFVEQNGAKQINNYAYVEHFVMGFTLKKHFGLAFGLKPFSRKGYDISSYEAVGTDSILHRYIGKGNVNLAFLGLSSTIIKYKNSKLSVGANLGYLFGAVNNERSSYLTSSTSDYGGIDYNMIRLKSFYYELGSYFSQTLDSLGKHEINASFTLEPSQKLRATQDEYMFYGSVEDPRTYDTLSSNLSQTGTIQLAPSTNFGINYKYAFQDKRSNNTFRNSELSIHTSFSSTDWTRYTSSFESATLPTSSRLTFGIQYTPEKDFIENAITASFMERMRYRAGAYSGTLPYSFKGSQLTDKGFTAGIGIPITSFRTLSTVNLGFSYGNRSTSDATGFNEKYIGISFGVTIAPSNFDRWFVRRKLD